MLFTRGELRAGETVLINSVGSGIGSAAVQLAKLAGAFVIGNASSDDKLARAKEFGLDVGINHATQDVVAEVMAATDGHGVDLVFEHVGGELFQKGLDSLAKDGRLVICGGAFRRGRSLRHHPVLPHAEADHRLVHLRPRSRSRRCSTSRRAG